MEETPKTPTARDALGALAEAFYLARKNPQINKGQFNPDMYMHIASPLLEKLTREGMTPGASRLQNAPIGDGR